MSEYYIYLRKSRADAEAESRGEGETLARHERALLDLARRQRLNVTQIFREVVSGETIAARPVMQQLLSAVEQGACAGVLVMEVERLARGDTIDQGIVAQTFKFSGTKIITPLKTYDPENEFDEEYFEFGLFMSRREYKTINRRLQRGRVASVREGKYVSNKPPLGYRRVRIPHEKGWTLEIVPEEAEVVRLIFQLYTDGELLPDGSRVRLGVSRIVRRLNEIHAKKRTAGDWVPSSVRDILINPVYVGKIRWNWRPHGKKMVDGHIVIERPRSAAETIVLADGLHPPIISEETFARAQRIMRENPPRPVNERHTVTNPLAGLVVCGMCGRNMQRRPYTSGREPSLVCPYTSCHNVSSDFSLVEHRVLDGLADWLSAYRLEWEDSAPRGASQVEYKRSALNSLRSDLSKLEKQLDSAHDYLEQGVYSTDKFLERSRILSSRIQQTQESINSLENEIALDEARECGRREIIPSVERLLDVYWELPDARSKNEMLHEVLEKVVYTKVAGARQGAAPDSFELVLYPKLPNSGV
ncbi:MAG: recombinase family protein [Lachnospiraceae bacterium]|nr:recombinase family protein [Lachnospiraceae bacterium]